MQNAVLTVLWVALGTFAIMWYPMGTVFKEPRPSRVLLAVGFAVAVALQALLLWVKPRNTAASKVCDNVIMLVMIVCVAAYS